MPQPKYLRRKSCGGQRRCFLNGHRKNSSISHHRCQTKELWPDSHLLNLEQTVSVNPSVSQRSERVVLCCASFKSTRGRHHYAQKGSGLSLTLGLRGSAWQRVSNTSPEPLTTPLTFLLNPRVKLHRSQGERAEDRGETDSWLQATGSNNMAGGRHQARKKKSGIMPDGQRFVGHGEIRPQRRVKSNFRTTNVIYV